MAAEQAWNGHSHNSERHLLRFSEAQLVRRPGDHYNERLITLGSSLRNRHSSIVSDLNTALTGKVAVVTGSSSGIGRAIALDLANAGADLIVHARANLSGAREVAGLIRQQGRKSTCYLADISQTEAIEPFVENCWKWQQRVDIWINNAGADVLTGESSAGTFEEKLETLWRVDVAGTIGLARLAGTRMRAQGGVILNIGWDRAESGMAGDSGEMFAATKGAVMAFSRSLAHSLAPHVRVNCLAPGWIKTTWGEQASEYWQERASQEALLSRWGTAEDVARAARFLVSPAAGFITGQVLYVNGGQAGADR